MRVGFQVHDSISFGLRVGHLEEKDKEEGREWKKVESKKKDGEMCEETHWNEDLLTDMFFQVHLVFLCQWVAAAGISPKTGKCDFLSGPLLQQEFTV